MKKMKKVFMIVFAPLILLVSKAKSIFAMNIPSADPLPESFNQLAYGVPQIEVHTRIFFLSWLGYTIIMLIPGIKAWRRIKNIKKQQNTDAVVNNQQVKQAMDQEIKLRKREIIILSIGIAIGTAALIYIIVQLYQNYYG